MTSETAQPITQLIPLDIPIEAMPIDPSSVLAGDPRAGWTTIPGPPGIDIGVWEHTVGTSSDVEEDEAFVVVSGRATVTLDDGRSYDFGPGDVGVLRAGTRTTWVVHETFRKVFIALESDDA